MRVLAFPQSPCFGVSLPVLPLFPLSVGVFGDFAAFPPFFRYFSVADRLLPRFSFVFGDNAAFYAFSLLSPHFPVNQRDFAVFRLIRRLSARYPLLRAAFCERSPFSGFSPCLSPFKGKTPFLFAVCPIYRRITPYFPPLSKTRAFPCAFPSFSGKHGNIGVFDAVFGFLRSFCLAIAFLPPLLGFLPILRAFPPHRRRLRRHSAFHRICAKKRAETLSPLCFPAFSAFSRFPREFPRP